MKNSIATLFGAFTLLAGTAGCSSKPDSVKEAQQTNEASLKAAGGDTVGVAMKDKLAFDADFLPKAASGGMLEVQLGREVARRAITPEAKQFAQQMVTDHTKANDELKALAIKKNISLPTVLGRDQQSVYDKVLAEKGADLDKKYLSEMLADHQEDVKDYQEAVAQTSDQDVRAYAQRTLPVLVAHLSMVQKLKPVVDAKK